MKFASLFIDMNFIGQAEPPQYHLPELRGRQRTQRKSSSVDSSALFSAQAELPFLGFIPARLA